LDQLPVVAVGWHLGRWRMSDFYLVFFFFFQAEDGIRDKLVTGVQTCALPISGENRAGARRDPARPHPQWPGGTRRQGTGDNEERSEERRVGKECRCRWSA